MSATPALRSILCEGSVKTIAVMALFYLNLPMGASAQQQRLEESRAESPDAVVKTDATLVVWSRRCVESQIPAIARLSIGHPDFF